MLQEREEKREVMMMVQEEQVKLKLMGKEVEREGCISENNCDGSENGINDAAVLHGHDVENEAQSYSDVKEADKKIEDEDAETKTEEGGKDEGDHISFPSIDDDVRDAKDEKGSDDKDIQDSVSVDTGTLGSAKLGGLDSSVEHNCTIIAPEAMLTALSSSSPSLIQNAGQADGNDDEGNRCHDDVNGDDTEESPKKAEDSVSSSSISIKSLSIPREVGESDATSDENRNKSDGKEKESKYDEESGVDTCGEGRVVLEKSRSANTTSSLSLFSRIRGSLSSRKSSFVQSSRKLFSLLPGSRYPVPNASCAQEFPEKDCTGNSSCDDDIGYSNVKEPLDCPKEGGRKVRAKKKKKGREIKTDNQQQRIRRQGKRGRPAVGREKRASRQQSRRSGSRSKPLIRAIAADADDDAEITDLEDFYGKSDVYDTSEDLADPHGRNYSIYRMFNHMHIRQQQRLSAQDSKFYHVARRTDAH